MIDLRDLICTAHSLEAKGFKRRAGEVWRRVVAHPEAPADVCKNYWLKVEQESKWQNCNGERVTFGVRSQEADRKGKEARAMLKRGMARPQIAAALGISISRVYAYAPIEKKAAH